MSHHRIQFVIAIACTQAYVNRVAADDATRARFIQEAPIAWRDYCKHFNTINMTSFTHSETNITKPNGETINVTDKYRCRYLSDGNHKSLVDNVAEASGNRVDSVEATNSQYSFHLSRRRSGRGSDSDWLLTQARIGADKSSFTAPTFSLSECATGCVKLAINVNKRMLTDLLSSGEFGITDAITGMDVSLRYVEIKIKRIKPAVEKSAFTLMGAAVRYLPDNNWVVQSYTVEGYDGVGQSIVKRKENVYDALNTKYPRILAMTETISLDGVLGKGRSVEENKFEWHNQVPTEDMFRLTTFGLPEPQGVKWTRPTPNYVWFLLSAAAFGIIAVLFRYISNKKRITVDA